MMIITIIIITGSSSTIKVASPSQESRMPKDQKPNRRKEASPEREYILKYKLQNIIASWFQGSPAQLLGIAIHSILWMLGRKSTYTWVGKMTGGHGGHQS